MQKILYTLFSLTQDIFDPREDIIQVMENKPVHEIFVLNAFLSNEDSGESAHLHRQMPRLTRAFLDLTHRLWIYMYSKTCVKQKNK